MRHKSIGMFHAAIDHTPNSDAVGKRQDGGGGMERRGEETRKEREGGKKAEEGYRAEGRKRERYM